MARRFAVRYFIDPEWKKEPEGDRDREGSKIPGVTVMSENYGYADRLFVASIAYKEGGKSDEVSSILLLDSREGHELSRGTLEMVKAAIEHHLDIHCK